MLQLNNGRPTQDFEEDFNPFAGDFLYESFDATESGVFQTHGLTRLKAADFFQGGVVAVLLDLTDALHQVVVQHGGLETETHNGGNAFGAAHDRDALLGLAGPKQDVTRKHGLKQGDWALFGFFELFVERQVSVKGLLLKIELSNLLLAGLGIGQVPTVGWRILCHSIARAG